MNTPKSKTKAVQGTPNDDLKREHRALLRLAGFEGAGRFLQMQTRHGQLDVRVNQYGFIRVWVADVYTSAHATFADFQKAYLHSVTLATKAA